MNRLFKRLIIIPFLVFTVFNSRPTLAMSREVRAVLVSGIYGAAVGTGLGLATFPFSGDNRTIFIGTSVGLYLGIAVGIYLVTHQDDPGNPLSAEAHPASRMLNEKFAQQSEIERTQFTKQQPLFVAYPVVRF